MEGKLFATLKSMLFEKSSKVIKPDDNNSKMISNPTNNVINGTSRIELTKIKEQHPKPVKADSQKQNSNSVSQILIYISLPACIAVIGWILIGYNEEDAVCLQDYRENVPLTCRKKCPPNHFSLPVYGMNDCHPWLTCKDIESEELKIGKLIGQGAVKKVYMASWHNHTMALNKLINPHHRSDFQHGLKMLSAFQDNPQVTQVLGYCGNSFVTEYHELGSADHINNVLKQVEYKQRNTIETRLALCIGYVQIINFLHNSPIGTRVMCDSNDLQKTLNQLLLHADLQLIVNDLDALPETNRTTGQLIKCGHRRIWGDFPAPEQLWPHTDHDFNDVDMPSYDEKTDIWKIPEVCDYFLGDVWGSDAIRFHLFAIHKQCKETEPGKRPTAEDVLQKYRDVRDELDF